MEGMPPLDLSECAREPIQFLGHVQAFGCLLIMSNDWLVQNASANTSEVLGLEAGALIGTRLMDHITPEAMHDLRGKLQALSGEDDCARLFNVDLRGDRSLTLRHFLHKNGICPGGSLAITSTPLFP